jgi:hypothetical protein
MNTILNAVLGKALHMKRPHNTQAVDDFTDWLWEMLPDHLRDASYLDGAGNLHVDARITDYHRTLFVAHVDTVHRDVGVNAVRKTDTHWYADGSQLGADDGAGVALLMHMMHNEVAGYYIFTQGEERGGIGAKYLADHKQKLLAEFDRAIAFDRRGIDSVITHQGWGRCCSDEFGAMLCSELGKGNDNLMHLNDDTGVYTDTAEFTGVIAECTNISVGYQFEHTEKEELNMVYFQQLADAVLVVDWDFLPVVRDPFEPEPDDRYTSSSWATSYKTQDAFGLYKYGTDEDDWDKEILRDALVDAQYGHYAELEYMIAELVYPEDVELVRKHLYLQQLDLRKLDEAIEMLETTDTESVLFSLYDAAYAA